jgi:hypothetical protein
MKWFERTVNLALVTALLLSLSFSNVRVKTIADHVHVLAADYGFDFISWTLNAAWIKMGQSAMGSPRYLSTFDQHQTVVEYLQLVRSIENTQNRLNRIYADPAVKDKTRASINLREQLAEYTARQSALAPFAESVLQQQVTQIIKEKGLTLGGQPVPWVLYHITSLPQNLIISSRDKIQQITTYQIKPGMTVEQNANL